MYNIIPLFLILLSLFVVIIIITRKFSVLASLDIDTIQAEKEAQFKEQIIGNRLKRNIIRYNSKLTNIFKPLSAMIVNFVKGAYNKLLKFKENYNKEEILESSESDVELMFAGAEELIREEKFEEAEKKLIDIISLDSQNLKAFKGLGRLYIDKKQYREAKQTFEHVLRLLEHDEFRIGRDSIGEKSKGETRKVDNHYLSSIYYELSKTCKSNEEYKEALDNIVRATEIEPNNPRYLDMKLGISIINKDKGIALDALAKLKEVNPENNKLMEFEGEIKGL